MFSLNSLGWMNGLCNRYDMIDDMINDVEYMNMIYDHSIDRTIRWFQNSMIGFDDLMTWEMTNEINEMMNDEWWKQSIKNQTINNLSDLSRDLIELPLWHVTCVMWHVTRDTVTCDRPKKMIDDVIEEIQISPPIKISHNNQLQLQAHPSSKFLHLCVIFNSSICTEMFKSNSLDAGSIAAIVIGVLFEYCD